MVRRYRVQTATKGALISAWRGLRLRAHLRARELNLEFRTKRHETLARKGRLPSKRLTAASPWVVSKTRRPHSTFSLSKTIISPMLRHCLYPTF